MDIRSGAGYPASALSNFAPHPFVLDGVECGSAEGLLQSFKFKNPEMQRHVCSLVGMAAKKAGRNKNWQREQRLWWRGVPYDRHGKEYQELLDRAYEAMFRDSGSFRRALLASGDAVLEHSMGRTDDSQTVLTRREFCGRLTRLREALR